MAIGGSDLGSYKQITASGNVKNTQGAILGIFCSSTTAGTIAIYDDAATGTATKIVDTFSPAANTYYNFQCAYAQGLNIVVGGTLSATVVYL